MGRQPDKNAAALSRTQEDSMEINPCQDKTPKRASSRSTISYHTAATQKSPSKASKDEVPRDLNILKKSVKKQDGVTPTKTQSNEKVTVSLMAKADEGGTDSGGGSNQGSGLTKEEEQMLKDFAFYHGYLPREDLKELLHETGDYLLRISETEDKLLGSLGSTDQDKPCSREIILSVFVDISEQKCNGGKGKSHISRIRNIIVKRRTGKYYIAENHLFEKLETLIAFFQQTPGRAGKKITFKLKNPICQQEWEFNHQIVTTGQLLGQGAFGEVRAGTLIRKGQTIPVAIKVTKGTADLNKEKIKEVMQEARLMRRLRHDNIVCIYGVAVDEQPIYIVLELVTGGALGKYLKSNVGRVGEAEKLVMCLEAARGVAYLHQKGMMHRDLAARNCLLTKEKHVKISDFGLSMFARSFRMTTTMKLPIKWLAPETIRSFTFSLETDIFSYGVLVYEIWTDGGDPWAGIPNADVKKQVMAGMRVRLPKTCPKPFRAHIKQCVFNSDPAKRAAMTDVVDVLERLLVKPEPRRLKEVKSKTPKTR